MGMTPMIAPDGSSGEVPNSKLADAIKAGGRVGAWMLDPQGNRGVIPLDRTLDAIKAGGRPEAPLPNVESQMPPSGLTSAQQKAKGEYESANLKPIAETLGAMATAGAFKTPAGASIAQKLLSLVGRSAASGAGVGAGAASAGASPEEIGSAAASGAIAQPVAEGVSAVAAKIAPKLAESALNITDRMRSRGRTIGDAVLEYTTGIKPSTLATESKKAIGTLVGQMEGAVDQATQAGVTGTAQPAHDALNDAIQNLPRNAKTLIDKFQGLNDLLDLGGGAKPTYTPNELLEMKRGIGKEMGTWPAEWQRMDDVKLLKSKLYGAIDGELDHLVPGNSELNQIISSLIPAKQQAARAADASGMTQRILHRAAAHTGALVGSAVGGAEGYREGGVPGAIAGATAGVVIPETLASSTGQMAAARLINSLGEKAVDPAILPFIKALIASGTSGNATIGDQLKSKGIAPPVAQPNTPGLPFHPGAGLNQ